MSSVHDPLLALPENLPAPVDDGAARHLVGLRLPATALNSTAGGDVSLHRLPGRTIVYVYPLTGRPGVPLPAEWDSIPGARGCTPQSCGFRDHYAEIRTLGARAFGLSSQSTAYQQEVVERLHLPFPLLSDATLAFANALDLPRFEIEHGVDGESRMLLKRITLSVVDGVIEHVFYPVFPPDRNASDVVRFLRER